MSLEQKSGTQGSGWVCHLCSCQILMSPMICFFKSTTDNAFFKSCRTLADFLLLNCRLFCWGQIGLKFVGTSACCTLANFLSWLTAFRLGPSQSSPRWKRSLFTWLSWPFLIAWGMHELRQIVLIHCVLADKAQQDVLRSRTVRYRLRSPDLVTDLSEFTAH